MPVSPRVQQLAFGDHRGDTTVGLRSIVQCRRFAVNQVQALVGVVEIHSFSLVNDLAFIFFVVVVVVVFRNYLMLLFTAAGICGCGDSQWHIVARLLN